jgi:hypothetical protein
MKDKLKTIFCMRDELFRFAFEFAEFAFFALISIGLTGWIVLTSWTLFATTCESYGLASIMIFIATILLISSVDLMRLHLDDLGYTARLITGVYQYFH